MYQSDIQPFLEQTPILPWQLELLKLLLISIKYKQQHQIRRWLNANQNSYLLHLPGVSFYLVPRYSFIFRKLYCIHICIARVSTFNVLIAEINFVLVIFDC